MKPKHPSIQFTGGFFLLCLAFLFLGNTALLQAILGAVFLHESAHWLLLHDNGANVERIRFSGFGLELQYNHAERLSYGQELRAVLAGPLSNFCAAFVLAHAAAAFSWETGYLHAGIHLLLGCFNSIPVLPCDGGRALYLIGSYWKNPFWADRAVYTISVGFTLLVTLYALSLLPCLFPLLAVAGLWRNLLF